ACGPAGAALCADPRELRRVDDEVHRRDAAVRDRDSNDRERTAGPADDRARDAVDDRGTALRRHVRPALRLARDRIGAHDGLARKLAAGAGVDAEDDL